MHIQNSSTWGKLPNTDSYCLVIARHQEATSVPRGLFVYRLAAAHDASWLRNLGHDPACPLAWTTVIAYATMKKA